MARTKKPQVNITILDTNAILWLYSGDLERFSKKARKLLESTELLYSPISSLEIQYLYELDKILYPPSIILPRLEIDIDLRVSQLPFEIVVSYANQIQWTRDPFDRIIVAQAQASSAHLITADKIIQKNIRNAFI
ncbi:MAG: type II toxin-antitoxin system VapC family toxin [bacterium]|nr:type II toxin-antitoxin system VapC family toxin [bacterium]